MATLISNIKSVFILALLTTGITGCGKMRPMEMPTNTIELSFEAQRKEVSFNEEYGYIQPYCVTDNNVVIEREFSEYDNGVYTYGWLTIYNGEYGDIPKSSLIFDVKENSDQVDREYTITITNGKFSKSGIMKIIQHGNTVE